MNRLIIIGNGFDLAHGLESKFSDFISNYFHKVIESFYETDKYQDPLLNISFKHSMYTNSGSQHSVCREEAITRFTELKNNKERNVNINSPLLTNIYSTLMTKRWVDIEVEFFRLLKFFVKNNTDLTQYNRQFDYLKLELEKYLVKEQEGIIGDVVSDDLLDCFTEPILKSDVVIKSLNENVTPDNLYFLNFNYTDILKRYVKECNTSIPSTQNQIHGHLNDSINPIIFGYGDEFDKDFIEFEHKNNNSYYRHIKSFDYLLTENYFSLIRFIENNDYQVHIYGHSCGLSDRTMLNQIFEHENCKSIKLFYHENENSENDYIERTNEISRHFKDKSMFRKKLVPLSLCQAMPQPE